MHVRLSHTTVKTEKMATSYEYWQWPPGGRWRQPIDEINLKMSKFKYIFQRQICLITNHRYLSK